MKNKKVFISYKSEEFEEASWVKEKLEAEGISCWMAPESIKGGSNYAAEIPQAIRNCVVFVVILSEKAQTSKWVPRELDQAINEEKIIMPFMVENCSLKDEFNFYLTNVQRYEAYKNKSATMKKMIKEIKAILSIYKVEEDKSKEHVVVSTKKNTKENSAEKAVMVTKEKKAEKAEKAEKHQNWKKKVGVAAVILLLIMAGSFVLKMVNTVTIAGKKVDPKETSLYFSKVTITKEDIELLGELEKLGSLTFKDCEFLAQDLGSLEIPTLYTLQLMNCGIDDEQISSIDFHKFTNLSTLSLNDNLEITNLEAIQCLRETVTMLDISNTGITNLKFLEGFVRLSNLKSENNGITDLSPLSECMKLYSLKLNGNQISSLEALSECENIYSINVDENQLTSLKGLEKNIRLTTVSAKSNQIASLEGLENATLLSSVTLDSNNIEDIQMLAKSSETLEYLYLNNNKVKDLSALKDCLQLKELYVEDNKLTSLESLAGCTGLEEFSAEGNELTSLLGLHNTNCLEFLDVSDNMLSDVHVLAELSFTTDRKVILDLSNNDITQLYLPEQAEYQKIYLYGNKITNLDVLSEYNISVLAFDYCDTIVLENLNSNQYYILECPLDKQVSVGEALGNYKVTFTTAAKMQEKEI